MSELTFGVLGTLRVSRAGTTLRVPGGARRVALARLLVQVGRPVSTDALIDAVWGGRLPDDPGAALHTVVSRLRHLLGEHAVRLEPAGYLLDVPAEAVDARRFEALLEQGMAEPSAVAGPLLDRALGLWRGPAYAEVADHDFATAEAHRLDQLRLDGLQARAALSLLEGAPERAVPVLESVLADHPFREQAVELLMTALYRSGRPADALQRYRQHRSLLAEELGLDPAPSLQDLQRRILGHDVAPPAPTAPGDAHRLAPAWLETGAAFIGREAELAALAGALGSSRVVTVTGPGGVGKSRLVAHALPSLAGSAQADATVVELGPLSPGGVDAAVAQAVGLTGAAGSGRQALLDYLSLTRAVLVLDSCEHVLAEVTSLVEDLVRSCRGVRVLATSRRRLGMSAELVLPLEPLPVPAADDSSDAVLTLAAPRLLVDRIQRLRPSFVPTRREVAQVCAVCRGLEGLPLALELAAARAAVLGVGAVSGQLASGDGLPREREAAGAASPLDDVVDWSFRLLDDEQRRLLAVLSVFPADFDLAAVVAVTGELGWPEPASVPELLAGLVESSLVATTTGTDGQRFRLLAMVRSFAADRLADERATAEAELAHARWVRRLTGSAATDALGPGGVPAFALLARHRADVEAAVRWALDHGEPRLAGAITGSLALCRHWLPGRALKELVVAAGEVRARRAGPPPALAMAAGACALADLGDYESSRERALQALAEADSPEELFLSRVALGVTALYAGEHQASAGWFRQIADADLPPAYQAEGHISLALLHAQAGELGAARRQSAFGLAAAEAAGAVAEHAFASYAAGEVATADDVPRALDLFARAVREADAAGARQVSLVARIAQLACLVRLGRQDAARPLALAALDEGLAAGSWPQLWTTLRIVAELLSAGGRGAEAAFVLAAAEREESAPPLRGEDVQRYARLWRDLRGSLGSDLVDRIAQLARDVPRTHVLDRARAAVEQLS